MEITINGKTYIVTGDYPNGAYTKTIKNTVAPKPTKREKAIELLKSVDKQAVISTDLGKVLVAIAFLVFDLDQDDL